MRNKLNWCLGDVFVSAMVLMLIGTAGVVAAQRSREIANRAKCASNLHQIGLAILLYQNDNNQNYPRAIMDDGAEHKPTWGTPYAKEAKPGPVSGANSFDGKTETPAPNDVTAAFYLLMINERITSSVFVCPSTKARPLDFGGGAHTALDWTNWPGDAGIVKSLSYGYQDPYLSNAAVAAGLQLKNPEATFVVAGDMGPGGEAETAVTLQSEPKDVRAANSPNHQKEGQNFLYGDGHVEFQPTPFAGTQRDNAYTAGGPEVQEPGRDKALLGVSSVSATDSILMPTYADVKGGAAGSAPLTPAELDKLKADVQGNYTATLPHGRHATLTIDAATVKCVMGPATIVYDYKFTDADGRTLHWELTAPDTHDTAEVTLDGRSLRFDTTSDFPIDCDWHR